MLAAMWKEELRFYGRLIAIAGMIVCVIFAWHFFAKQHAVISVSQEKAETAAVQKETADKAGIKISDEQAELAAKMIRERTGGQPDEVLPSTGRTVRKDLETLAGKTGGYIIVTDPAKPQEAPLLKSLSPEKPLDLNVYNIKPYPNRLLEVTVYRRAADIALLHKVSVFKRTGYLGPAVSYDAERSGKVRVGLRLTIPLD